MTDSRPKELLDKLIEQADNVRLICGARSKAKDRPFTSFNLRPQDIEKRRRDPVYKMKKD